MKKLIFFIILLLFALVCQSDAADVSNKQNDLDAEHIAILEKKAIESILGKSIDVEVKTVPIKDTPVAVDAPQILTRFFKLTYNKITSKWTIDVVSDSNNYNSVVKFLDSHNLMCYQIIVKADSQSEAFGEGCQKIYRKINKEDLID
jgi:hypothetical protein